MGGVKSRRACSGERAERPARPQSRLGRARDVVQRGRVVRTKLKATRMHHPPWRRAPWQAATSPTSPLLACRSPESLRRRPTTSCKDNHQTTSYIASTCCRAPTPTTLLHPAASLPPPALPPTPAFAHLCDFAFVAAQSLVSSCPPNHTRTPTPPLSPPGLDRPLFPRWIQSRLPASRTRTQLLSRTSLRSHAPNDHLGRWPDNPT